MALVQVVFVHGVNTRTGELYNRERSMRNDLFTRVAFAGVPVKIHNPYWGEFASSLSWHGESLPEKLAPAAFGAGHADTPSSTAPGYATVGYAPFVDALFASLVEEREQNGTPLNDAEIAQFKAAGQAWQREPDWFARDMADPQLVGRLTQELREAVGGPTAFPLGNPVADAVAALAQRAWRGVSVFGAAQVRPRAGEALSRFVGDAFVFLKDADRRKSILSVVTEAMNAAFLEAKAAGGKLVVVAHSFGGVIVHDICARGIGLVDDFSIDLLTTVGSQPGLFEELKLFDTSDPAIPSAGRAKVARAGAVADWMNVFDAADLLGFRAEPIFEGCSDYNFESAAGLLGAHTAYFKSPQFYARFAARMRERGIIP